MRKWELLIDADTTVEALAEEIAFLLHVRFTRNVDDPYDPDDFEYSASREGYDGWFYFKELNFLFAEMGCKYRFFIGFRGGGDQSFALARYTFDVLKATGAYRLMLTEDLLSETLLEEYDPDPDRPSPRYPTRRDGRDIFAAADVSPAEFAQDVEALLGIELQHIPPFSRVYEEKGSRVRDDPDSPDGFSYETVVVGIVRWPDADEWAMRDDSVSLEIFADDADYPLSKYIGRYQFHVNIRGISSDWSLRAEARDTLTRRLFEGLKMTGRYGLLLNAWDVELESFDLTEICSS